MAWFSYIHRTYGGSLSVHLSQDLRQSVIDHMIGRIPGSAGEIIWSHEVASEAEAARLTRRVGPLAKPKKYALAAGDAALLAELLRAPRQAKRAVDA